MRGKRLLLGLAILIALVLTSCAGLPGLAPREPVTIRYLHDTGADLETLAEAFQSRHSNITIELVKSMTSGASCVVTKRWARALMPSGSLRALPGRLIRSSSTAADSLIQPTAIPAISVPRFAGRAAPRRQADCDPGEDQPVVVYYNVDKFNQRGSTPDRVGRLRFVNAANAVNTDESFREPTSSFTATATIPTS